MSEKYKPTLILDFDGVLHSYVSGWKGADVIPDPPVEGAVAFCERALEVFHIHVVSSRCSQVGGPAAIGRWLREYGFPDGLRVSQDGAKPAALVTLDDRALTFDGTWPEVGTLLAFEPWNRRRSS